MRTWAVAIALFIFAAGAQGGAPSRKQWTRIAEALERAGTSDSLITAAIVRREKFRDSKSALADLDRALVLDPNQPDNAWLALSICTDTAGCDSKPRAARLRELDPANAAGFEAALTSARTSGDVAAEDGALAAIADSSYYDIYWSRLITRGSDALTQPLGRGGRPLRALIDAADDMVTGLAGAALPSFTSISRTCKGDRLAREDVVKWCREVARVLDGGDTYLASMFGRVIAFRVWPPESTEAAEFREGSRQYNYVREQTEPFENASKTSVDEARRMIERYRAHRREQDVFRQWLIDLGLPPEAPAGWQPAK